MLGQFLSYLFAYVAGHPEFRIFPGSGFKLASDPDIVRAPDVAIVRRERLPARQQRIGYLELAPDLTVEVISPTDRAGKVAEQVSDYLDHGVRLVWLFYPGRRSVVVHTPDRIAKTLRPSDELDGGDVLPGFALSVIDIFPDY